MENAAERIRRIISEWENGRHPTTQERNDLVEIVNRFPEFSGENGVIPVNVSDKSSENFHIEDIRRAAKLLPAKE